MEEKKGRLEIWMPAIAAAIASVVTVGGGALVGWYIAERFYCRVEISKLLFAQDDIDRLRTELSGNSEFKTSGSDTSVKLKFDEAMGELNRIVDGCGGR